jgi:hypothetical protein
MLSPSRMTRSLEAHLSIVIDARKSAMMAVSGSAPPVAREGAPGRVAGPGEMLCVT